MSDYSLTHPSALGALASLGIDVNDRLSLVIVNTFTGASELAHTRIGCKGTKKATDYTDFHRFYLLDDEEDVLELRKMLNYLHFRSVCTNFVASYGR